MIKKVSWQYRKHGFNPWIGKIPWRWKWLLTPVFLSGKSMDRGAWRTTVCRVTRVGHNLVTKQQTYCELAQTCCVCGVQQMLVVAVFPSSLKYRPAAVCTRCSTHPGLGGPSHTVSEPVASPLWSQILQKMRSPLPQPQTLLTLDARFSSCLSW